MNKYLLLIASIPCFFGGHYLGAINNTLYFGVDLPLMFIGGLCLGKAIALFVTGE